LFRPDIGVDALQFQDIESLSISAFNINPLRTAAEFRRSRAKIENPEYLAPYGF